MKGLLLFVKMMLVWIAWAFIDIWFINFYHIQNTLGFVGISIFLYLFISVQKGFAKLYSHLESSVHNRPYSHNQLKEVLQKTEQNEKLGEEEWDMLLTLVFSQKPLSPTEQKVQNKLLIALYNRDDTEQDEAAEMTKKIIKIWHTPIFGTSTDENGNNKKIEKVKLSRLTHAYLHRIKDKASETPGENEN